MYWLGSFVKPLLKTNPSNFSETIPDKEPTTVGWDVHRSMAK
jgi:hypothetical protein